MHDALRCWTPFKVPMNHDDNCFMQRITIPYDPASEVRTPRTYVNKMARAHGRAIQHKQLTMTHQLGTSLTIPAYDVGN